MDIRDLQNIGWSNKPKRSKFSVDLIWCLIVGGVVSLLTLFVMANFGCSASRTIAEEANKVQNNAVAIKGDARAIKDANAIVRAKVPVTQPAVKMALATIDSKADDIDAKSGEISTSIDTVTVELTKVQDVVPVWLTTLKYGLVVILFLGILFVMWRLNLFLIIERGIQLISTGLHALLGKFMGA